MILLFAGLVVLGNVLSHWFIEALDVEIRSSNEQAIRKIIVVSMVAYVILIALPFVPGVEIGLGVLMILGPKTAPLVYLCTLAALSLSFGVGRFIPERMLISLLGDLHFRKATHLLTELEGLDAQQRLRMILQRAPIRIVPFLLRHRYIALIVALNLPGNMVIGGGGGIALMAGLSRFFTPYAFVLTVAIAVSPVPLAWLVLGDQFADWIL
jgi:hypothetical protein